MQITNTPYVNHTGLMQRSTLSSDANKGAAVEQSNKVKMDSVSISDAGRNVEAKWKERAQKYDVTNMSGREVMKIAIELYDNNLISEKDSLLMYVPSSLDEKYNYLDSTIQNLEITKKYGLMTEQGLKISEKRIDILEKLSELFIRSKIKK
jgi:hypothetical protein